MPKKEVFQHSVLIISASEQFDALIKKSFAPGVFQSIESRRSASLARRAILERFYDMVIINAPLPDENGVNMALDAAEKTNASVLLVVPKEVYNDVLEKVTDEGVLVMYKPAPKGIMDKAVRFLTATQNKLCLYDKKVKKAEEKLEEMRIVNKAKFMLVEKKSMTEDDAHRLIGKTAMDNGISRARAASMIMDDLE